MHIIEILVELSMIISFMHFIFFLIIFIFIFFLFLELLIILSSPFIIFTTRHSTWSNCILISSSSRCCNGFIIWCCEGVTFDIFRSQYRMRISRVIQIIMREMCWRTWGT
ncbi:hypothetical protein V8G54_003981 [Vigna mungo]|uniref:Uncharacterized protein n=1 Tax=Vigna mungo TaxID=3915 RepID=A0AAQ3PD04_VIGMU